MLYRILLFCLICNFSGNLTAQIRTHLGVNMPAWIVGTADLQSELQLGRKMSLQIGTGLRSQSRELNERPSISFLREYIHLRERAGYLSVGLRLFDEEVSFYQYPFISFNLVGMVYKDRYSIQDDNGKTEIVDVSGAKVGGNMTIGFVVIITDYINLDLAVQMGYSPPRTDLPAFYAYYLPGMGYSTFGTGVIGVRGGHLQPIISLRYNIVRDKRQRIRAME